MKKIERANGKYAIVKMRMFASFTLEGYEDLKKCEASLLRIRRPIHNSALAVLFYSYGMRLVQ